MKVVSFNYHYEDDIMGNNAKGEIHHQTTHGISAEHQNKSIKELRAPLLDSQEEPPINTKIPLPIETCWKVEDICFEFNSLIVKNDKGTIEEFKELANQIKNKPDAPISIFGHADPIGDDDYNHKLSVYRAKAIYGILIQDVKIWKEIYQDFEPKTKRVKEIKRLQDYLTTIGHYSGPNNGEFNEDTEAAVKSYIETLWDGPELTKENFLGKDGDGKCAYQGCGEFNPLRIFSKEQNDYYKKHEEYKKERNEENQINRRVVVLLFKKGTQIDSENWPCYYEKGKPYPCNKYFRSDSDDRREFQKDGRQHTSDKENLGEIQGEKWKYKLTNDTFACCKYSKFVHYSPCEEPKPLPPPNLPEEYHPGIILFPSLMTPEIIWKDQDIEILILGREEYVLTKENINWQLKITEGLDPYKNYTNTPLFETDFENNIIEIIDGEEAESDNNKFEGKKIGEDIKTEDIIKTQINFSGIIDKRAVEVLLDEGYNYLYNLKIKNVQDTIFKTKGIYNLFWLYTKESYLLSNSNDNVEKPSSKKLQLNSKEKVDDNEICKPEELHDKILIKVLEEMNGDKLKNEKGKYCFKIGKDNIDVLESDFINPIQAYHPLYYNKDLGYCNIANLSDLHLSSRECLLSKSNARVIEYEVDGKESDLEISPPIGKKLYNINSRNVKELLDKIGRDKEIDVLLIGGDLIDYVRSLFLDDIDKSKAEEHFNAGFIWKKVDLENEDNYKKNYQKFVDLISFYSFIIYYYQKYKKPVFVVSGNHDCYDDAYGISPRVLAEMKRANEGIPADLNLTTYEANLIFGESCHEIVNTTMFNKDNFKWFYTVFTPFSDFSVNFPEQNIVGLAWGDEEDVIGVFNDVGQGFWGHLPRSDQAISDKQLEILKGAMNGGKKVILFSHFTFVSYNNYIPFSKPNGDVEYEKWSWDASEYDMGTFETNRKPLYTDYLYQADTMRCAITGHSHRRGLFLITGIDYSFDNSVKTDMFDFPDFTKKNVGEKPIIIGSDSAGPLPRYNNKGEFRGWGSYNPSATKVVFDKNGRITDTMRIEANSIPRIIVPIDYINLLEEDVIRIKSESFSKSREQNLKEYTFNVDILKEIYEFVRILSPITIYSFSKKSNWSKIKLNFDKKSKKWKISGSDVTTFYNKFFHDVNKEERKYFLSIKFRPKNRNDKSIAHYNFNNYWNCEFNLNWSSFFGNKSYEFEPEKEHPDFKWRAKNFKKYQ